MNVVSFIGFQYLATLTNQLVCFIREACDNIVIILIEKRPGKRYL